MLPRIARLTSPDDFARTTKSGFRFTSPSLVTYLYITDHNLPARCGLIISKSAGGSVVRHKIARQLRHALRSQLTTLPKGALVVVRALPSAGQVSGKALSHELTQALTRLLVKSQVTA